MYKRRRNQKPLPTKRWSLQKGRKKGKSPRAKIHWCSPLSSPLSAAPPPGGPSPAPAERARRAACCSAAGAREGGAPGVREIGSCMVGTAPGQAYLRPPPHLCLAAPGVLLSPAPPRAALFAPPSLLGARRMLLRRPLAAAGARRTPQGRASRV